MLKRKFLRKVDRNPGGEASPPPPRTIFESNLGVELTFQPCPKSYDADKKANGLEIVKNFKVNYENKV